MTTNKQAASEYEAVRRASEPAYPHLAQCAGSYEAVQHTGLTKRELFAMEAMQAIVNAVVGNETVTQAVLMTCKDKNIDTDRYIARSATEYADALIAELERTK